MSIADVLEKAADYIEEHGWCRGIYRRGDGHVCALGAIAAVAEGAEQPEAVAALGLFVGRKTSTDLHRSVYSFNDRQRRREPVLRALRDCAASLRATS